MKRALNQHLMVVTARLISHSILVALPGTLSRTHCLCTGANKHISAGLAVAGDRPGKRELCAADGRRLPARQRLRSRRGAAGRVCCLLQEWRQLRQRSADARQCLFDTRDLCRQAYGQTPFLFMSKRKPGLAGTVAQVAFLGRPGLGNTEPSVLHIVDKFASRGQAMAEYWNSQFSTERHCLPAANNCRQK